MISPTGVDKSESDGEAVPGGGGGLSEQCKSTSIREEDIKAGEALLDLMDAQLVKNATQRLHRETIVFIIFGGEA